MSTITTVNMPAQHGDAKLKCGQCRWFVQGFNGRTCQVTRKVVPETRACIEFQPYKQSPFEAFQKDKFLIEMRKTLLVWTEETVKKYSNEIKTYRLLKEEKVLKDPMSYVEEAKLAELGQRFETVQIYAERLLDLRYEIMDKKNELNSFSKEVQAYLFTEYRDLVQSLKNDSERGSFYRHVCPELYRAVDHMDTLHDKAELAYQALKDCHFALTRKQEAVLELWKSRIASQQVRSSGKSVG